MANIGNAESKNDAQEGLGVGSPCTDWVFGGFFTARVNTDMVTDKEFKLKKASEDIKGMWGPRQD